jgi:putative protein kinase ArgK-like GTPase of G3E family
MRYLRSSNNNGADTGLERDRVNAMNNSAKSAIVTSTGLSKVIGLTGLGGVGGGAA